SGCRNSNECAGQCDGQIPCNCNANHVCVNQNLGGAGDPCGFDSECPGGTRCAANDPTAGLVCDQLGGAVPGMDCAKSCRTTCDMLVSLISDTCPAGTSCGGDGGFLEKAIMALVQGLFGGTEGASGSICY